MSQLNLDNRHIIWPVSFAVNLLRHLGHISTTFRTTRLPLITQNRARSSVRTCSTTEPCPSLLHVLMTMSRITGWSFVKRMGKCMCEPGWHKCKRKKGNLSFFLHLFLCLRRNGSHVRFLALMLALLHRTCEPAYSANSRQLSVSCCRPVWGSNIPATSLQHHWERLQLAFA